MTSNEPSRKGMDAAVLTFEGEIGDQFLSLISELSLAYKHAAVLHVGKPDGEPSPGVVTQVVSQLILLKYTLMISKTFFKTDTDMPLRCDETGLLLKPGEAPRPACFKPEGPLHKISQKNSRTCFVGAANCSLLLTKNKGVEAARPPMLHCQR